MAAGSAPPAPTTHWTEVWADRRVIGRRCHHPEARLHRPTDRGNEPGGHGCAVVHERGCGGTTGRRGGALDDATAVALTGSEVAWQSPAFPIGSISTAGVVMAANVYANTSGVITGRYLGVSGSGVILVLDNNLDNFGLYAGDQIPDGWQIRYFGENNPNGLASATNCTGRTTSMRMSPTFCPTNPAACFEIVSVSNQPPNRVVCFKPASTGRVYRLLYATNLVSGYGRICRVPRQCRVWATRCRYATRTSRRFGSTGSTCRRRNEPGGFRPADALPTTSFACHLSAFGGCGLLADCSISTSDPVLGRRVVLPVRAGDRCSDAVATGKQDMRSRRARSRSGRKGLLAVRDGIVLRLARCNGTQWSQTAGLMGNVGSNGAASGGGENHAKHCPGYETRDLLPSSHPLGLVFGSRFDGGRRFCWRHVRGMRFDSHRRKCLWSRCSLHCWWPGGQRLRKGRRSQLARTRWEQSPARSWRRMSMGTASRI